jgi:hypothetical protein
MHEMMNFQMMMSQDMLLLLLLQTLSSLSLL